MRTRYFIMSMIALLIATVSFSPTAQAKEKRAFEIADYYRTAFVRDLAVSPDGERIAFTVTRQTLETGERSSELWMARSDGSRLRQVKLDHAHPSSLRFSPDGKRLLFVSDHEDGSQLWTMPARGGKARKLTDFPTGVSDPVFSPDGRYLAVTAEVYPECGADAKCNRERQDAREGGPLEAYLADSLLYRHWTSWNVGQVSHVLLIDAKKGKVLRDLTPGPFPSPIFNAGRGYDFSRDGSELVFTSNRERDQASTTNADLWAVSLEGGEVRNLTATNKGWDGSPLHSPDGRYIAFRSQATLGAEADLFRLALYDREARNVRYLTDRSIFDDWIDEMAWTSDSRALFFQAPVKGRTPLFRLDLASGEISEILTDAQIDAWHLLGDGSGIVYIRRSVGKPAEIYRVALDGSERRQLTDFNADLLAEVDFREAEEMWVKGAGDYDVQVFVVKPHGFDPSKRYPLILNVHGGPQSQWTDSYRGDWQVYPGKGYVVAFPNPTGSLGRGQDFVDAISCDWGGRVYDDLMKVTDALVELPWVDESRLGSMGWSYGGYMMMWFQGQTDRFKAQAAMMGIYDLASWYGATEELWFGDKDLCGPPWRSEIDERFSPSQYVENFSIPALVITGELDYRVPYTQSLQYFTALQKMGVPSRLIVFPKAGHWPGWYEMAFYYLAHLDWFHQYLGGEAPEWDVEKFLGNRQFGDGGH